MKKNKKVAAVVITAVAISGSATALANASGTKAKSISKKTTTTMTRVHMNNGVGGFGGMRGNGGPIAAVLADLVTKGTITAAEDRKSTRLNSSH